MNSVLNFNTSIDILHIVKCHIVIHIKHLLHENHILQKVILKYYHLNLQRVKIKLF